MTDASSSTPSTYGAYNFYKLVQVVLVTAFAFLTYTQGTTAYINTQKAIEAVAIADNAAVKQRAEAVLYSQQAITALEIARNAAERTKAEADALEAEADKIQSEAATLKQKAVYADQKTRADALTISNEFELRKAKAFAALAELRNITRKEKAEVEKLEASLVQTRQAVAQQRNLARNGMGAFFGR